MSRYEHNDTMRMIGHSTFGVEELTTFNGYDGIMDILEAYAKETMPGKIITNVKMTELAQDIFAYGVIHGIRKERRRRADVSEKV